jgi:putative secretion ATPase (PEP-CTERM system associated)
MYERFYNLRERPFSLTPDPDYLYPSRVHTEALSYLRYGIEGHAGFVVVTGEIGSGKTTLLQAALRGLDRQTSVARLVNTMLDPRELLEAVMLDFGLEPGHGWSKPQLLREFGRFLVEQRAAGRLALLVIDEAQNLSQPALEEVRMLSNLETEKSKLIQIVLVGQPNLRDLMARPELEQLRQRITVSYHLRALDASETAAYINHRLRKAAIGAPLEFPTDVTGVIGQASQGLPRKINVIADAVLLFGYGEDQRTIDLPLVRAVLAELEATGVLIPAPVDRPAERVINAAPTALAAPSAPSAPSAAAQASAVLEQDLAIRESKVAQREREVAAQQRVLTEQFRLLRMQAQAQAPAPAVDGSQATRPAWQSAAAPAAPSPAGSSVRPAATTTASASAARSLFAPAAAPGRGPAPAPRAVTLWGRVRRGLLGLGKPLED